MFRLSLVKREQGTASENSVWHVINKEDDKALAGFISVQLDTKSSGSSLGQSRPLPLTVFPINKAMQPHIGVNENENELTHVQKGRTYSEYELLAFPDGYDLLASSRRSRYTAQYTLWKLMNLQARIRILGTPWHNPVTEVFVYRGLGGDSISLSNCNNVKQMLYQLDELTGCGDSQSIPK